MTDVPFALGGGMALAVYHGGVVEACVAGSLTVRSLAGASAGAVTCVILGGSPEGEGLARLRHFWGFD